MKFYGLIITALFNIILLITFSGCTSDQICGLLVDNFKEPVSGASIRIENSGFSAISDEKGQFCLDYAPGILKVVVSAEQYVPHTIMLNIAEKSPYPLGEVVLTKIPRLEERDGLVIAIERDYFHIPTGTLVRRDKYTGFPGYPCKYYYANVVSDPIMNNSFLAFFRTPEKGKRRLFNEQDGVIAIKPSTLFDSQCLERNAQQVENMEYSELDGITMVSGRLDKGIYCLCRVGYFFGEESGHYGDEGTCFIWEGSVDIPQTNPAPKKSDAGFISWIKDRLSFLRPEWANQSTDSKESASDLKTNDRRATDALSSVRDIDFRNFDVGTGGCYAYFQSDGMPPHVDLKNGMFNKDGLYFSIGEKGTIYADLTGDGREEAAIVADCGYATATWGLTEIYVFSIKNGKVVLLDHLTQQQMEEVCSGLPSCGTLWSIDTDGVRIENGALIIEWIAGGSHATPNGHVRFTYRLENEHFKLISTRKI